MSPFMSNDRPSLHDHFSEPSGIGSALASVAALGLRLIRRCFGAGAFGLAAPVVSCANAVGAATSIVVDSAPTTVAISSLFMEKPFYLISVKRWTARRAAARVKLHALRQRTADAIFSYLAARISNSRVRCNLHSVG